jgi:DNA-binding NarL/FixJ family response regulator
VTRVLVVAASPVTRAGLESVLARGPTITVVGAVTPGEALASAVETNEPDVVLIDVEGTPLGSPTSLVHFDLAPDALARAPAAVVMSDARDATWVVDAMRAGVRAVLPRDATPEEIIAAIDGVAAGLTVLPRDLADSVLNAIPRAAAQRVPPQSTQPLSPRETEILGMLAEGLANKVIAARLGISEHTVKTHVASIFAKLDAYTRTEAVARAVRLGLIML